MLQTYDLPAGGRQINARATFIRYRSAVAGGADDTIRIRADGQDLGVFSPGDWLELPAEATRWEIVPMVGTVTGKLTLGMGRAGSDNLSAAVRVIGTEYEATIRGSHYIGSAEREGSAGLVSIAGMLAVARPAVVSVVTFSSTTAGTVQLVYASGAPTLAPTPTVNFALNKFAGQPNSSASAIRGSAAGAFPTGVELPGATAVVGYGLTAGASIVVQLSPPVYLAPGRVLAAVPMGANRNIVFAAEFEELT
jgi:hypothetical protein